MWSTPDGERILQGAERRLFREALSMVVDSVRDDNEGFWRFNVPPFDDLQPNQKLALLARIGTALLREDEPMPKPTAVLEAAVGAVYEAIRILVEMEIDQLPEWRESPSWRELVLAACRERGSEELLRCRLRGPRRVGGANRCPGGWRIVGRRLARQRKPLGCRSGGRPTVKAMLGIDEDYYVGAPPDPTDAEMEGVWAALRELTAGTL